MKVKELQEKFISKRILFEGHVYELISSGNSAYTELSIRRNHVALFNVKSRTIRAIPENTEVKVLKNEESHPESDTLQPRWTPFELELRKDKYVWDQVKAADNQLGRFKDPLERHVCVIPLCSRAAEVFERRGFKVDHVYSTVKNDKFYPVYIREHSSTILSW